MTLGWGVGVGWGWGGQGQQDDLGRRLRTPHGHEYLWMCCRQYPTRGAETAVTLGWGVGDEGWFGGGKDNKMTWVEGYELPTVMSTFGCVVANIPHEVLKQQ